MIIDIHLFIYLFKKTSKNQGRTTAVHSIHTVHAAALHSRSSFSTECNSAACHFCNIGFYEAM